MGRGAKTTGYSYYEPLPSQDQRVGDLWRNLPAFGHLRKNSCDGIVITPACDLANRKVETITFLPIIPVKDYLLSRGFAVEMVRVVRGQARVAGYTELDDWQAKGIGLPTSDVMQRTLEAAQSIARRGGKKEKEAASRICAAVRVLQNVRGAAISKASIDLPTAMGEKDYERCISDIVRNAYSPDIHFLPADGRLGDMSVMEEHSVALFRYPIAVPVDLLDSANDVAVKNWSGAISKLRDEFPIAVFAEGNRPVKVGALRPTFLPDLISRFAALHIRMGSPDFTRETIDEFVNQLKGAER